jgi:hypothetical protein
VVLVSLFTIFPCQRRPNTGGVVIVGGVVFVPASNEKKEEPSSVLCPHVYCASRSQSGIRTTASTSIGLWLPGLHRSLHLHSSTMPPKPKVRPQDQKNASEQLKVDKANAQTEKEEEASWAVGAKGGGKAAGAAQKEEERLRKNAEKAALEAQDEMSTASVFRAVKTKKKGSDDFDLLNAALSKQPKTKAQKEAEEKKKAAELKKKKEAEATAKKEEAQKVSRNSMS